MRERPHNIESEKAVIGCALLDIDCADTVYKLSEEDFYKNEHKAYLKAIKSVLNKKLEVDLVSISQFLSEEEVVNLALIANEVITTANFKHYLNILKDHSLRRRIIDSASNMAQKAYDSSEEIKNIVNQAESQIFSLENDKGRELVTAKSIIADVFDNIAERYKNKGQVPGLRTGFDDLDYLTGGLMNGELYIVAARPAMGKTAFALNIAEYVAMIEKKNICVFSLEMSKQQLVTRMLSSTAMVKGYDLKFGTLGEEGFTKLARATGIFNECLYIDDTPMQTYFDILSKCRKLKRKNGLELIIIDYLQLMDGTQKSRREAIEENSRGLKILAKELDIPVICLSQLSRAPEMRNDHRPILSDLRETGAIEQDADAIMFLYRDEYYRPDTDMKNMGEVIVSKNRNGATGTLQLLWLGEYTKYANLTKKRSNQ